MILRPLQWIGPVSFFVLLACGSKANPPAGTPAVKINGARPESELATLTLTADAERRLGIVVEPALLRPMPRRLESSGEVVIPPGQSLLVTAPIAGTVEIANANFLHPGNVLRRGQFVLALAPLPAVNEIASLQIRVDVARKRRDRAAQLLVDGAGSRRALEDAEAELQVSEQNARATQPGGKGISSGALRVVSPGNGILRDLRVGVGQTVAAGTPLFQVDAATRLWVRAIVYAGDAWQIDREAGARVSALSMHERGASVLATSVTAPPSANPDTASVDMFFALPAFSADAGSEFFQLRPGQRVAVSLSMNDAEERLVIPWSAVLFDSLGGTWAYVRVTEHKYERRRIDVHHVVGETAVLARGLVAGTMVVGVGAHELFGTEFGAGK